MKRNDFRDLILQNIADRGIFKRIRIYEGDWDNNPAVLEGVDETSTREVGRLLVFMNEHIDEFCETNEFLYLTSVQSTFFYRTEILHTKNAEGKSYNGQEFPNYSFQVIPLFAINDTLQAFVQGRRQINILVNAITGQVINGATGVALTEHQMQLDEAEGQPVPGPEEMYALKPEEFTTGPPIAYGNIKDFFAPVEHPTLQRRYQPVNEAVDDPAVFLGQEPPASPQLDTLQQAELALTPGHHLTLEVTIENGLARISQVIRTVGDEREFILEGGKIFHEFGFPSPAAQAALKK